MIEIKQNNTEPVKADPTRLLLEEAEVRAVDPKVEKHEKSGGEKLFDRGVYTGIGLGVNELSTLVIADEFEHGIGKNLHQKISQWMVKTFNYKDVIKNGKLITAQKGAGNMLLWASLLTSGTLLLWPMKWLEDHKGEYVQKANHWLDGGKLSEEEVAARDAQVEKDLACQPKQTWPTLLLGRLAAMAAVMGLGAAMGENNTKSLMAGSERLLAGSVAPVKNRAHRYAALLGLETLACTTSSVSLEVFSKLFGKAIGGMTVRNPELCTQLVHEKPPVSDSGSSDKPTTSTDTKTLKVDAPVAASHLDKFKSKAIIKQDSHVESVAVSDTSFSLST